MKPSTDAATLLTQGPRGKEKKGRERATERGVREGSATESRRESERDGGGGR